MERITLVDGTVLGRERNKSGECSYTTDEHFDREPPLWAWLAAESKARKEAGSTALEDAADAHYRETLDGIVGDQNARDWLRERAAKMRGEGCQE